MHSPARAALPGVPTMAATLIGASGCGSGAGAGPSRPVAAGADDRVDPIRVISVRDLTISEGDQAIVQGRIATFDARAIENDLRVTLDQILVDKYCGRQVLAARSSTKR